MGKYKPRHNPDKEQNKYGGICEYYEGTWCHNHNRNMIGDVNVCKGNRHNCVKCKYRDLASKMK
jgi:hypothetical protein